MDKQRLWDDYQSLNLCGGTISFISEDDEDMIEINAPTFYINSYLDKEKSKC